MSSNYPCANSDYINDDHSFQKNEQTKSDSYGDTDQVSSSRSLILEDSLKIHEDNAFFSATTDPGARVIVPSTMDRVWWRINNFYFSAKNLLQSNTGRGSLYLTLGILLFTMSNYFINFILLHPNHTPRWNCPILLTCCQSSLFSILLIPELLRALNPNSSSSSLWNNNNTRSLQMGTGSRAEGEPFDRLNSYFVDSNGVSDLIPFPPVCHSDGYMATTTRVPKSPVTDSSQELLKPNNMNTSILLPVESESSFPLDVRSESSVNRINSFNLQLDESLSCGCFSFCEKLRSHLNHPLEIRKKDLSQISLQQPRNSSYHSNNLASTVVQFLWYKFRTHPLVSVFSHPVNNLADTARLAIPLAVIWLSAQLTFNVSLRHISVSLATMVSSLNSFFTQVLSLIILNVPFRTHHAVSVGLSIVGTFLVIGDAQGRVPPSTVPSIADSDPARNNRMLVITDVILCLLSAILYSLAAVLLSKNLRFKNPSTSARVSMFMFGCFGVVIMFLSVPLLSLTAVFDVEEFRMPPSLSVWILIIVNALFGTVASNYFWAASAVLLSPLMAMIGQTCQVPLSVITDCLILKSEKFSISYFCGSALVIGSLGLMCLDKSEDKQLGDDIDSDATVSDSQLLPVSLSITSHSPFHSISESVFEVSPRRQRQRRAQSIPAQVHLSPPHVYSSADSTASVSPQQSKEHQLSRVAAEGEIKGDVSNVVSSELQYRILSGTDAVESPL